MDLNYLLDYEWEQFVGRKQPPLNGVLVSEGFADWVKKRYGKDARNIFLLFCERDSDCTTDVFVNEEMRKQLVLLLHNELGRKGSRLRDDIAAFRKETQALVEFSKKLDSVDEEHLAGVFDEFCTIWRKFGPSIPFVIFTELAIIGAELSDKQELIRDLAEFRKWRKQAYNTCWFEYSKPFLTLLGRVTGLGDYIDWASPAVVAQLLKSPKETSFDNKALVYYDKKSRKIEVAYGAPVVRLKDMLTRVEYTNELHGVGVHIGKVRGKVTLLKPYERKANIDDGSVIVSKMTTPDLITNMKRAAAVVTDEGGLTSHAAVICRELRIPCVVGTRVATKAFKDNDEVEVDADKGTVRKVSSS
jgi:phosphohistidine swiveling domain-containing protein